MAKNRKNHGVNRATSRGKKARASSAQGAAAAQPAAASPAPKKATGWKAVEGTWKPATPAAASPAPKKATGWKAVEGTWKPATPAAAAQHAAAGAAGDTPNMFRKATKAMFGSNKRIAATVFAGTAVGVGAYQASRILRRRRHDA